MLKFSTIIPAGGIGSRFDEKLPKQFYLLNNKPILIWTIEKFIEFSEHIIISINEKWYNYLEELLKEFKINAYIVKGKETRQLSVFEGLKFLEEFNPEYVAIHDAVRPFVNKELIHRCVDKLTNNNSVIPVIPINDTIIQYQNNKIISYPDRNILFRIQTPQFFKFNLIYEAHKLAIKNNKTNFSDDSQIITEFFNSSDIVLGDETNIKITTKKDLDFALFLLNTLNS